MTPRFEAYRLRREREALAADLPPYHTVLEQPPDGSIAIGSAWTRERFGGDFYRSVEPAAPGLPRVSLVFVQSREGNTVAPNPSMLGGGDVDKHLIYEGLSRIDADGVLAGAATARARELVFSIWHPELVALRLARGHARHPAQVLVTDRGDLPFDEGLMFHEPGLRVFVITRSGAAAGIRSRVAGRSWIEVIDAGEPLSLARALGDLAARGVRVISAVGGRRTATALIRERTVTDIYLTTSPISAGEPDTPFYDGPPLETRTVVVKTGTGVEAGVRFEHLRMRLNHK